MGFGQTKRSASSFVEALELVRKSAPPPPKDQLYRYLRRILRFRQKFKAKAIRRKLKLTSKSALHPRKGTVTRMIIDSTAGAHVTRGMRWKYDQVLEYARLNGVKPKELRSFIEKKKGGMNAVISAHRQTLRRGPNPQGKSPQGTVRGSE